MEEGLASGWVARVVRCCVILREDHGSLLSRRRAEDSSDHYLGGILNVENHRGSVVLGFACMGLLEVMYKFACGKQGISSADSLGLVLGDIFADSTVPTANATVGYLLQASKQ